LKMEMYVNLVWNGSQNDCSKWLKKLNSDTIKDI